MTTADLAPAYGPALQAQCERDREAILDRFGMARRIAFRRNWDDLTAALPNFAPSALEAAKQVLRQQPIADVTTWLNS